MKFDLKRAVAVIALVLSVCFTSIQAVRYRDLMYGHGGGEGVKPRVKIRNVVPSLPIATTAVLTVEERVNRMTELIAKAPRGPGNVPLVAPESVIAYFPEVRGAYTKASAAHQRIGYGQFVQTAGLPPSDAADFNAILARREAKWADIRVNATMEGLPTDGEAIKLQDEQNIKNTETDLMSLLGEKKYAELLEYRDTIPARNGLISLNALIATSYASDAPVTLTQIDALAKLTAKAGVFDIQKAMAMQGGPPFDLVVESAGKILTPKQMEVFNLLMDSQQISLARSIALMNGLKK